jgi:hypothetical protein
VATSTTARAISPPRTAATGSTTTATEDRLRRLRLRERPECRPREICGNCIDDDGDGLVDGEDPDCCTGQPLWIDIKRLRLKPGTGKAHGNRIRLKVRASSIPAGFDPMTKDTSGPAARRERRALLHDGRASHWKHPHKRLFKFKDKAGTFAGGLKQGRFKMRKSGKLLFATRGKKMNLRESDGKKRDDRDPRRRPVPEGQ